MPNTREKLICDKCSHKIVCKYKGTCDECNQFATNGDKWISVKDRLPENDYGKHWKERKYYLVRFAPSGLMCVAHYGYKEYDWWIDEHDCVLSATNFKEVTHWMEITNLPQPPKGE